MILVTFAYDCGAPITLLQAHFETILPQHEWRGIVDVMDYLSGDMSDPDNLCREIIEEPLLYQEGDPILLPEICLIFLSDQSDPPAWARRLHQKIRQHLPKAYQIWISDTGEAEMEDFNKILQKPEENSFFLNISYPQGFPMWKSPITVKQYADLIAEYGAENCYTGFIDWLKKIIG